MSLSTILLALFVLLQSLGLLGWYAVSSRVLGFVGLAYVVILLLEVAGIWHWGVRTHKS